MDIALISTSAAAIAAVGMASGAVYGAGRLTQRVATMEKQREEDKVFLSEALKTKADESVFKILQEDFKEFRIEQREIYKMVMEIHNGLK